MKKRLFLFSCFAVLFAFLLLNTLSAVTDEPIAKETELPSVVSDLLSGKNTDLQSALSNLEEADFPLALTICEVLQHKALHQDIKTSTKEVEAFKVSLQKRLETSQTISFKQTSTCIQKVAAREIVIEGKHLTVPEHYLAPVRFAITGFSPTGEGGTLLPDIQVVFVGGKPPIESKILLDGKQIPAKQSKNSFVYRPVLQPGSILRIGSHKVQAVLSDSEKQIASVSWSFTVGIGQTADIILPSDANSISSFSIQVQELFPDSPVKGLIVVEEFQTSDGKRVLEYSVFNSDHPKTPLIKTQSLIWLRRLVEKGRQRPTITIKPGSPNAFPGNILNLSAKYDGPGFVAETSWHFSYGEPSDVNGAEVSRPLGPTSLSITCYLTIKEVLPDGSVSQTTLTAFKTIEPLVPIVSLSPTRRAQMSETGTGTINIDSVRYLKNKELVEGAGFDIGEGHLTVVKSQIRLPSPTNEVSIENPVAKATKLSFAAPAAVDVVNDVSLTYEWKDEKYTGDFTSGQNYNGYYAGDVALLGVFLASGTTRFKSLPPGIIRSTSRKVAIKEIEISIGGETHVFSPETGTDVNPSWILARSALFPASAPIEIKGVSFRANLSDTITIPQTDPFQYLFKFDPNWGVPHEGYFKLQVSCRPTGPGFFWFPVSAWSTIMAFPENSALTQVLLSPANPAPIYEEQSISFSAAIGPQTDLGEGSFDSSGGELDILKGYKVTKVTSLQWKVVKGDSQTQEDAQWNFVFDPQKGPGTYTVSCQAVLEAIEKETDSKVTLKGSSSCRPGVLPGLRIYSPIGSFSYPLGATIDVRTSFDGSFDDWKKIEWILNDNPWQPDLQKPPLRLILNKTGDWSLTARMKTNDPDGHEVNLENTANFAVFPTSIVVSPTRKLTTLGSEPVNLELKVSLNNQPVKSTQESVDLPFYAGQVARVESIKWQLIPGPGVSASFKPSSNPFLGATTFSTAGAVTILGTATVRVSSSQTNPYSNNVSLTFPVRADAWGIETPDWGNTLSGRFPNKAIVDVGRTFEAASGSFSILGKTYDWFKDSGKNLVIELPPALPSPNVVPPKATKIGFLWNTSEGQIDNQLTFLALFKMPGLAKIDLNNFLDFGMDGNVFFNKRDFSLQIFLIGDLIKCGIEPTNFEVLVGDTETFQFKLDSIGSATPTKFSNQEADSVLLLGGDFRLSLSSVSWESVPFISKNKFFNGLTFDFSSEATGSYRINATATAILEEILSGKNNRKSILLYGAENGKVVPPNIVFYEENGLEINKKPYYLGQKMNVICKAFSPPPKNKEIPLPSYTWRMDPPAIVDFEKDFVNYWGKPKHGYFVNSAASFYLFNYDQNKPEKIIQISFEYGKHTYDSIPQGIKIKKPKLFNLQPIPGEPQVVNSKEGWVIGFPEEIPAGMKMNANFQNGTEIPFDLNIVQFINADSNRVVSNGSDTFSEYFQTISKHSQEKETAFWLDNFFPYSLKNYSIPADNQQGLAQIFYDDPRLGLESSEDNVTEVNASTSFRFYGLMRPSRDYVKDSIWCPVFAYSWNWYGTARKISVNNWAPIENSKLSFTPLVIGDYFSWNDKYKNSERPKWEKAPRN